jgi:benzoate/toluate 1,2-dioxygenase alpha subunit
MSEETVSTERSPGLDYGELFSEADGRFRVSRRAYTDPSVFDREMKQIFERTWVYVAHESEIEEPGAYKTSYIGVQPVIVSRGRDRSVNVMFNRCRHRGASVCREKQGTANFFRCPYHGWVYSSDGTLVGVAQRDRAYAPDWEQPDGLVHVAQVDSYRGLIFACMDPDASSLADSLGPKVRRWIDRKFGLSSEGRIRLVSAPIVVRCKANWKFPIENILDGYHYNAVHTPFMKVQEKYGNRTGDYGAHVEGKLAQQAESVASSTRPLVTPNGHLVTSRQRPDETLDVLFDGELGAYYKSLVDIHGRDELAYIVNGGIAQLYPNLGMIHHQLRVVRPIAANLTEISIYPYDLVGAPAEYNTGWLHSQERFYGPTGYGMPDDYEMFELNQQGLQASEVEWLILERGMRTDLVFEDGALQGTGRGPETNLRGQLMRWRELMTGQGGIGR